MNLKILAFGITKDIVGGSQIEVEIPEGSNLNSLKEQLLKTYPAMEELASILIAVNNEYGEEEQILRGNDEIALIPPVSGG